MLHIGLLFMLFITSILAPSPIPVPTDFYAIGLLSLGVNFLAVVSLLFFGQLIGLIIFYELGYKSGKYLSKIERKRHDKAYIVGKKLFHKYGKYSLVLAPIPVISKPLIITAAAFKVRFIDVFIWYMSIKVIMYFIIFVVSIK